MRNYSEHESDQMAIAEEELDSKHGLMLLDNRTSGWLNST